MPKTIITTSNNEPNILLKLFPQIEIKYHDRFSKLSFLPKQNLSDNANGNGKLLLCSGNHRNDSLRICKG